MKLKRRGPTWWRYLDQADRDGVYNKLSAIAWAFAFLWFTPTSYSFLPALAVIVAGPIVAGGLLGIFGRIRHDLLPELFGMGGVLFGFGFYTLLQAIWVFYGNADRIPLTLLAFALTRTFYGRFRYLLVEKFWPAYKLERAQRQAEREAA
jgi:hypothetical protein